MNAETDLGVLKKCPEFEKIEVMRTVKIKNYATKIQSLLFQYCPDLEVSRIILNNLFSDIEINNYLDVNCRNGKKMQDLYRTAKHVTAIDVIPEYLKQIKQCCPNVQVINANIADIELPETYDLITWDHGLYYQPTNTWASLCRKLYQALRPGGQLLILVNSASRDWYRALTTFSGLRRAMCFHYMPIDQLQAELEVFATVTRFQYDALAVLPKDLDMGEFIGQQILEISDKKVYQQNYQRFVEFAQELPMVNQKRLFSHVIECLVLSKG